MEHSPVVEECLGCQRINVAEGTCQAYLYPWAKWDGKMCPLATHLKREEVKQGKQLDPIKKSKREVHGK